MRLRLFPIKVYLIFATSIDKLISSSAFTGNEIRSEVDYEESDDPNLNIHHITKNYTKLNESEGVRNDGVCEYE